MRVLFPSSSPLKVINQTLNPAKRNENRYAHHAVVNRTRAIEAERAPGYYSCRADLDEIRQLDQLCFPPNNLHREPAAPGELEKGIDTGRVRIVKKNGAIVGFLQYEQPLEDHIYISALGVQILEDSKWVIHCSKIYSRKSLDLASVQLYQL